MTENKEQKQRIEESLRTLFAAHARVVRRGDDVPHRQSSEEIAETAIERVLAHIDAMEAEQSRERERESEQLEMDDILRMIESSQVEPLSVLHELAQDIDGMFFRLPPAEEMGLDDVPETAIERQLQKSMDELATRELLEEPEEVPESFEEVVSSSEPPEEETSQEESESDTELNRPGGKHHAGQERNVTERAEQGTRKSHAITVLQENPEEWVTGEDVAEFAGDLKPDNSRDRRCGSRALQNAMDYDWLDGDIEKEVRGSRELNRYRYIPESSETVSEEEQDEEDESPEEEEETSEESTEEPEEEAESTLGVINKNSVHHESIALLSELCDRTDRVGVPVQQLSEVSRTSAAAHDQRLRKLRDQRLVDFDKSQTDGSNVPVNLWYPTQQGQAELNRLGGYQINNR